MLGVPASGPGFKRLQVSDEFRKNQVAHLLFLLLHLEESLFLLAGELLGALLLGLFQFERLLLLKDGSFVLLDLLLYFGKVLLVDLGLLV